MPPLFFIETKPKVPRIFIDHHESGIMPSITVLAPGIAKANNHAHRATIVIRYHVL
jgi:hypothetical protein